MSFLDKLKALPGKLSKLPTPVWIGGVVVAGLGVDYYFEREDSIASGLYRALFGGGGYGPRLYRAGPAARRAPPIAHVPPPIPFSPIAQPPVPYGQMPALVMPDPGFPGGWRRRHHFYGEWPAWRGHYAPHAPMHGFHHEAFMPHVAPHHFGGHGWR